MKNILLLHGALGSSDQLEQLATSLAATHQVYRMNFSGHGRTPSRTHAATVQNYAHEVLDFLNEKQLSQITIFGYSMGGYVALWLARFYPARVEKVVTLGTKFHWNEAEAQKEIGRLNADKIKEKVPAFAESLAQRHGKHEWHSVLSKTAHLMHDLAKHQLQPSDFEKITCEVLLLLGDSDNMVTLGETEQVQKILPNSQLEVLPGTPHPIEQVSVQLLAEKLTG